MHMKGADLAKGKPPVVPKNGRVDDPIITRAPIQDVCVTDVYPDELRRVPGARFVVDCGGIVNRSRARVHVVRSRYSDRRPCPVGGVDRYPPLAPAWAGAFFAIGLCASGSGQLPAQEK